MKIYKLIPLIVALTLLMTSCQLGSSVSKNVPAQSTVSAGGIPYPTSETVALPAIASNSKPYPATGEQAVQPASVPYPAPKQPVEPAAPIAYPAPAVTPLTGQSEPVCPDLQDGAEIKWSQVESIVYSGQVDKVGQTHDLKVYITLKDGRTFSTVEPAIDEIIKLVKACGELCKDIKVATE
jgi:hypothetical protein